MTDARHTTETLDLRPALSCKVAYQVVF